MLVAEPEILNLLLPDLIAFNSIVSSAKDVGRMSFQKVIY